MQENSICKICGKDFIQNKRSFVWCSRECYQQSLKVTIVSMPAPVAQPQVIVVIAPVVEEQVVQSMMIQSEPHQETLAERLKHKLEDF